MRFKSNRTIKSLFHLVSLFLVANLVLAGMLGGSAAAASYPENSGYETISLPPGADRLPQGFFSSQKSASHPKMDSTFAAVVSKVKESHADALLEAQEHQIRTLGERVQAQIKISPENLDAVLDAIVKAGGEATGVGFANSLVQAWLPVEALESLSTQTGVQYLSRPAQIHLDAIAATTEGLAAMNGSAWHSAGFEGAGVKVGIIDGGFQGYPALLGSDLPAGTIVKNFVDGENDSQVDGTSEHGTACAEIVYDIVPSASIYLAKISTPLDVEEAVNWLKNTHQVDVISTSFSFFNTAPGDGTGYLADLVQTTRNAGILWAKSAGNYREMHWGGAFSDPDGNDFHNFNGDQEINYFGPGDGTAYGIPDGVTLRLYLRWSDWTNVNQDFDFHLVRWNGSSWSIVASSTNPQNGGAGQMPTETLVGVTSGGTAPYGFIVESYNSSQSVNFEILAPATAHLDEITFERSLGDIADAPAALTVAAVDVVPPYNQESYSSEGPTNGPGGIATGGAVKPDIAAYANVSTVSYGSGDSKFNGTSSATPHVAGAAALVKSAYPAYGPDQLQSFLEGRAIDQGAAGKDTQYGSGRLYLGDPPAPPPSGKTWNGSADGNWHNPANWTPNGVPSSTDDVTIPNTANNPIILSGDAQTKNLTVQSGARLDLGTQTLHVEGTLVNNGTLQQSKTVLQGQPANFLRITNNTGTQTKYYGVDLTPSLIGAATSTSAGSRPTASQASENTPLLDRVNALLDQGVAWFQRITGISFSQERQAAPTSEPGKPVALTLDSLPPRDDGSNPDTVPEAPGDPVNMVLDDGFHETAWGVNNNTALTGHQFLWLNRFTPDPGDFPLILNEIWVMFDNFGGGANVNAGDDVDLVIYRDSDTNPANGATYLATINETIQAVNGSDWSVFPLTSPLTIETPGDVLVGVINRYTQSGVSDRTWPATLDTSSGQDRSWIAYWSAIPPSPPVLPPDNTFDLMTGDNAGNWMIRAYGEVGSSTPTETPTPTSTSPEPTPSDTPTPTSTPTATLEPPSSQVTVSISGNQVCEGRFSGVERCYDIEPANAMTATVRFYFTEAERAGLALNDLLVYHYDVNWNPVIGPLSSGGSGESLYVEATGVSSFSPFALDTDTPSDSMAVYIPFVLLDNGPPVAPTLNAIDNPDGDGSYTISWSSSAGTDEYILEEAPDAGFSNPTTVYTGSSTSTEINGRDIGTYYYRVRAGNLVGSSAWSNTVSVQVTVPPPECPQTGVWTGKTNQGRNITFEVEITSGCQIAEDSLKISIRDSCYFDTTTVFGRSFAITNNHFNTGNVTYGVQVIGDFSSPASASGSFDLYMPYPFIPPPTHCTASGTWTASP